MTVLAERRTNRSSAMAALVVGLIVAVGLILAWLRPPQARPMVVVKALVHRHTVCVAPPDALDQSICGWIATGDDSLLEEQRVVSVVIHEVRGIEAPVIEIRRAL